MTANSSSGTTSSFQRTSFTWLAYLLLGFFAYLQSSWGPIMPLLRDELNLSFTVGGFHATAFAVGMVVAGLLGDTLAIRLGDRQVFWLGGAGMAAGALLLTVASNVIITVTAALVMGSFGTLLLVMIQSGLANEHRNAHTTAITEANIVASAGAATVPLLVGGLQSVGLSWRLAIALAAGVWLLLFLFSRNITFPSSSDDDNSELSRPLPLLFWLIWAGLFCGVAAEWSIALWTADFLIQAVQVEPSLAAASVAIFTGSAIGGRLLAARLALRYSVWWILGSALVLALIGMLIFWQSRLLPLNLAALALMGIGIAGVYPLGVSAAMQIAPQQTNRASARASLGAAMAILIAPQTLGILADSTTITRAYSSVGVLIIAAIVLTVFTAFLMHDES